MMETKQWLTEIVGPGVPVSLIKDMSDCLINGELVIVFRKGEALNSRWNIEVRNADGTPKADQSVRSGKEWLAEKDWFNE